MCDGDELAIYTLAEHRMTEAYSEESDLETAVTFGKNLEFVKEWWSSLTAEQQDSSLQLRLRLLRKAIYYLSTSMVECLLAMNKAPFGKIVVIARLHYNI